MDRLPRRSLVRRRDRSYRGAVVDGVGVMSRRERDKGVRGEREVLELLEAHGFEVRGLEASGDHLAIGHGVTLHVETKRQEVARPWLWHEQAVDEAPAGTIPLVAFRRSRSRWLALVDLEELVNVLSQSTALPKILTKREWRDALAAEGVDVGT